MGHPANQATKKPYLKAIILGIISIALYITLFVEQSTVNEYVSRGGMFAFFPILAAFLFSAVHGGFTGSFWTMIGIEAKRQRR